MDRAHRAKAQAPTPAEASMILIALDRHLRKYLVSCDTHGELVPTGQTTSDYAWQRAKSHRDETWCMESIYEVLRVDTGFSVIGDLGPVGLKRYRDRGSAIKAARFDESELRGQ